MIKGLSNSQRKSSISSYPTYSWYLSKMVRIILDLSTFNEAVHKPHFKMNNIHTATSMLVPGAYMSSVDLQDAYFTFPIRRQDRKFIKFRWQGQLWQFVGLPMGISCAPRIFTKLITPIFAFIRKKGGQCFPYLDDSFIFGFTKEECRETMTNLVCLFTDLGFKVHTEKSVHLKNWNSWDFL